jgi:hypothetical protein
VIQALQQDGRCGDGAEVAGDRGNAADRLYR